MFNTNCSTRSDEDEEVVYTTQTNIFIIIYNYNNSHDENSKNTELTGVDQPVRRRKH